MKLTELKQTSPERFTLIFDNGAEIKSSLTAVTDLYLCSGKEFTEEEFEALCAASSLSLCRMHAMRLINTRAMSAKEMRDKLVEKGESPENAGACAEWLCEMGLISDESYAAMIVRHYSAKGYGVSRVRQELYRRGIDRELWDDALQEMPEQDDKLERFIRSRLTDPTDRAQVQKICAALIRRGYTWEQVKHALNNFAIEEGFQ